MMKKYQELIEEYKRKKNAIKKRLQEFHNIDRTKNRALFQELCFCLLTPQSNARKCDSAVRKLRKAGLLFKGGAGQIKAVLKGMARFHNKKADYIVNARKCFGAGIFNMKDNLKIRDSLVKDIKGLGYKEASHFLRNIGRGKNIAILDRHILKNLKRYGAIKKIPSSMTAKAYLDIEERARHFARRIRIPLEELDLLLWSKETGQIFK